MKGIAVLRTSGGDKKKKKREQCFYYSSDINFVLPQILLLINLFFYFSFLAEKTFIPSFVLFIEEAAPGSMASELSKYSTGSGKFGASDPQDCVLLPLSFSLQFRVILMIPLTYKSLDLVNLGTMLGFYVFVMTFSPNMLSHQSLSILELQVFSL